MENQSLRFALWKPKGDKFNSKNSKKWKGPVNLPKNTNKDLEKGKKEDQNNN